MIYLSLGSNLGNRLTNLQQAVALLKSRYLKDLKCSIVLETQSLLPNDAPSTWNKPYLNMIVSGTSDLAPLDLLKGLKKIEAEMGRPADHQRWSPRLIDLDILLLDGVVLYTPELTLPHPELKHRDFLLHLLSMMDPMSSYPPHQPLTDYFLNSFVLSPQLVGIVNVTADSFSDGGKYKNPDKAIAQVLELASSGASVIELGAQSTRPGAIIQTPEAEYAALKPILDALSPQMKKDELKISIDTFWPEVIHQILENYSVAWINDVKGALPDATLKNIAAHPCEFVIMHSCTIPADKKITIPTDVPAIKTILEWAEQMLEKLLGLGFKQSSIILDPGIGFGKSAYQNMSLLQDVGQLKKLGCSVLVGHSRKSFMNAFSKQSPADRDIETLAISALLKDKVDYLRVHNIKDHQRFLVANRHCEERSDAAIQSASKRLIF